MVALVALLFAAFALHTRHKTRRRVLLVLALIGGPAVLLNITAVTLIVFVLCTRAVELPPLLALIGLARSAAGAWWGGLVMLREIGDATWHASFAIWLAFDLSIAMLVPSPVTFLLSAGGLALHLIVTALHDSELRVPVRAARRS